MKIYNGGGNWLSTLLDDCQREFEAKGVVFERSMKNELNFFVLPLNLTLSYKNDDDKFLELYTVLFNVLDKYSRKRVLEAVNATNYKTKVAKAYIDRDEFVVLSAELYVNPTVDFTRLFKRHVNTLITCHNNLFDKLK